jgi:hypothetical protein
VPAPAEPKLKPARPAEPAPVATAAPSAAPAPGAVVDPPRPTGSAKKPQ